MLFWTTLFSLGELSLNFWKEKQQGSAMSLLNLSEYALSYISSKCIFDHICKVTPLFDFCLLHLKERFKVFKD